MRYQNEPGPRLKTFRNWLLTGAFALGCGTMAIGCSSIGSWWHNMTGSRSDTSATSSYNNGTSSNYSPGASNNYSSNAGSSSSMEMNSSGAAAQSNANAAENNQPAAESNANAAENNQPAAESNAAPAENNGSMAMQENSGNESSGNMEEPMHRQGHRRSMRQATHEANEQEARAAAQDMAPRVSADISRAQGESANRARDLYQRGEQDLNNGKPVRALRDFNRAERMLQTSMNTSEFSGLKTSESSSSYR